MPTHAVLFDFDGVIADTENVHVAAWQRTLAAMGWELDDEIAARAVETDDRDFLQDLFIARRVVKGDVDGWVARKQELTLMMLTDAPRVYPGVVPLVERLRATGRVKLGVVTSAFRANVTAVLKAAGIDTAFEVVVSKESVKKGKPDSAGYKLALQRLGVEGHDAVALEDSTLGIASTYSAGLRVVAVGSRRGKGTWTLGVPYLPDLRDTDAVLAALGLAPRR